MSLCTMSKTKRKGRPSSMGSCAEVIVAIEMNENPLKTGEASTMETRNPMQSRRRMTRAPGQGAKGAGKDDPEKVFRDALVGVSSTHWNQLKELQLFMAKSDEYPRFVWEKVLLSFAQEPAPKETFGPFALNRFSRLIEFFPDIFQRELLRDSFQLPDQPDLERYGVLHAAALCGRTDLVYLVRGLNKSRDMIFKALTPNESDDVSESFHLLRRALLWRHMTSISYAKVAVFMKKIEKARKSTDLEAWGKLIDETAPQIDLTDAYDPWIVILAWSSVSTDRNHIIGEFEKRKPDLLEQMITKLRKRGSAFTHFLIEPSEETVKITLPDNTQLEVRRTVQDIVKVLVLQKNAVDSIYVYRERSINPMQRFFLDRFCDRTPDSRWTPLHLAAARGDQNMVSILIASWDLIIEKLDEEQKKIYTRKLEKSFYDAKYMTPLHYAVLRNQKEVVKSLVDWKMFTRHINECDIFMRTAFQMACSKEERAIIVQELITDTRVDVNTKDCCKFTSLHWAVHSESTETVKHIIFDGKKRAIRIIEKDREEQSPYEMAARGRKHSHKDIQQLLLNHNAVKDQVERLYRDRQVYVDASNAILVGAALIASVTFGGWLQTPAGGGRDVRIFWGFNSLSFFFSIATVTSGAAAVLPVGDEYIKDAVESIRRWLVITSCLLIFSVACVLGAFAAAGFSSLSKIPNFTASDNNNMIITTSIGGIVCGTIGLGFCARLYRVRPHWLNLTFKGNFGGLNKESIRRNVDSLIRLPARVSHLIRGQMQPASVFEKDNTIPFGPTNAPVLESLPQMITEASNNPLFRTPSLTSVHDSLPPIEVDRERIRQMWERIHPHEDINVICPIRRSYRQLELVCLEEISNLKGLEKEQWLGEYMLMWKEMSEHPLRASSSNSLLVSTKIVPSISNLI